MLLDGPRLDGVVVLVVDDNPDSRDLVELALVTQGATVMTADCGVEALRIVEKTPPDVLLSDIGLPEMDGYELMKKIRLLEQQNRLAECKDVHLPAAAITAFTSVEDRRKSILAGFRFHIAKPVDFAELVETVASLAGQTEQ
jgi:CheY-like chemotaxis protein